MKCVNPSSTDAHIHLVYLRPADVKYLWCDCLMVKPQMNYYSEPTRATESVMAANPDSGDAIISPKSYCFLLHFPTPRVGPNGKNKIKIIFRVSSFEFYLPTIVLNAAKNY